METYKFIVSLTYSALINFVNNYNKTLICDDCDDQAIYNFERFDFPCKCKQHRIDNMVVRINYKCIVIGCTNCPFYFAKEIGKNGKPLTPRILCIDHPTKNFNLYTKNIIKCQVPCCKTLAGFNYSQYSYGLFCENDKFDNMKDRISNPCSVIMCGDRSYNKCSITLKNFCNNHLHLIPGEPVSINYRWTCCGVLRNDGTKCPIRPIFGPSGYNPKNNKKDLIMRCCAHKPSDYEDLVHKKCSCGSDKRMYYAKEHINMPTNCVDCRTDVMTNVMHRCHYQDENGRCGVHRHYNYPGFTNAISCVTHALPGMIIVTNKICDNISCLNFPRYGFPNGIAITCEIHCKPNMVDLYEFNKCEDCNLPHDYVIDGRKKCKNHAPTIVTNEQKRLCKFCNYPDANTEYNCGECKNKKMRIEKAIVRKIKEVKPNYEFIHDKPVNAKTKHRPDLLFKINETVYFIVEIDEENHRRYTLEDEIFRVRSIHTSLKKPYLGVIRFNPDVIYDKITKQKIVISPKERFEKLLCAIEKYYKTLSKGIMLTENSNIIRYKQLYCGKIKNSLITEINCEKFLVD